MSERACKQILCLGKLQSLVRTVEKIERREDFKDEDYDAVIACAENASADLERILASYTG